MAKSTRNDSKWTIFHSKRCEFPKKGAIYQTLKPENLSKNLHIFTGTQKAQSSPSEGLLQGSLHEIPVPPAPQPDLLGPRRPHGEQDAAAVPGVVTDGHLEFRKSMEYLGGSSHGSQLVTVTGVNQLA